MAVKLASRSDFFLPNFSFSASWMTSMSISKNAASAPAYAMLRSSVRSRSRWNDSTHIRPSGTPSNVMSSRSSDCSSGHDESESRYPPGRNVAMSLAYVPVFSATTRSISGGRAVYPSLLTRMSYQVGRPWMFDGKMFLPETGIPIRKIDCMSSALALALPVPLTVAILKEKSLTAAGSRKPEAGGAELEPLIAPLRRFLRAFGLGVPASGFANAYGITNSNFLISHAAVGQRSAQSPQCRQTSSSFTMTRFVWGRAVDTYTSCDGFTAGAESLDRRSVSSPSLVMVRQRTGQTSTHASHSMHRFAVKCVSTSQLRQRATSRAVCSGVNPSSTSTLTAEKRFTSSSCVIFARGEGL